MARAIWKGAISFGLVHIPVALQSATSSDTVDFDWLDDRSMDPVGYKRINKVTGKEVSTEHIVKGVQYEKGQYVILSEDEIRTAHPASTQTIDIFSFVDSKDIPLTNIDTPYYLAPDKRGEKVYALLRETLSETGKVALAYVILHTRQHLAALMPIESALVLILLRWPKEVRDLGGLELTESTTKPSLTKSEKDMARRLVEDMKGKWNPEEYLDTFKEKIMQLVEKKARDGEVENVETSADVGERKSADVIDLTELLKRSLRGKSDSESNEKSVKTIVKKSAPTSIQKNAAKKDAPAADAKSKTKAPAKAKKVESPSERASDKKSTDTNTKSTHAKTVRRK